MRVLDAVIVYGSAFCQVTIMRVAAGRQGWLDALAGGLLRFRRWANRPTRWELRAWDRRAVRAAQRELRRAQRRLRVEQLLRR